MQNHTNAERSAEQAYLASLYAELDKMSDAYDAADTEASATEANALLEEFALSIPQMKVHHINSDRYLVVIIEPYSRLNDYRFTAKNERISGADNIEIVSPHAMLLRSRLPQENLKSNIEWSFIPD